MGVRKYQEQTIASHPKMFLLSVEEQREVSDMNKANSATTATLLATARTLGFLDYDVLSGAATTKKVTRLRAPNGRPIVIQNDNVNPRIWVLPDHEADNFSLIGQRLHKAGDDRHSNLRQVREFAGSLLQRLSLLQRIRMQLGSLWQRSGQYGPVYEISFASASRT